MDPRTQGGVITGRGTTAQAEVDLGLRAHMLKVYNYMALGLALTGVIAYAFSQYLLSNPAAAKAVFGSPLVWVVMLAPLAIVFFLSFRIQKMSLGTAQISYWLYAAINGISFAAIFLMYTQASVAKVFFITAASFGALSLYGYTTKRDLSGMRSFLIVGVVGLFIAMIVNIFLKSSGLDFAISAIGVLLFAGLTAYDTQKIKEIYYGVAGDATSMGKAAIMGALQLYLDFINMFLFMLRLFGASRE